MRHSQKIIYSASFYFIFKLSFHSQDLHIFTNGPFAASFLFIFGLFQTNITIIYNNIMLIKVHPVSGAGI